jgi:hypothetical protein
MCVSIRLWITFWLEAAWGWHGRNADYGSGFGIRLSLCAFRSCCDAFAASGRNACGGWRVWQDMHAGCRQEAVAVGVTSGGGAAGQVLSKLQCVAPQAQGVHVLHPARRTLRQARDSCLVALWLARVCVVGVGMRVAMI